MSTIFRFPIRCETPHIAVIRNWRKYSNLHSAWRNCFLLSSSRSDKNCFSAPRHRGIAIDHRPGEKKYAVLCKYMPPGITPEGDSDQPVSRVPVLLFNGELDPLDPPENVAHAKDIWPNSLSLTLPWQGHSLSDPSVIYCMGRIMRQFVEEGSAQKLSSDCLQDIQPPRFATNP
jgi:hypothetical protein